MYLIILILLQQQVDWRFIWSISAIQSLIYYVWGPGQTKKKKKK